ncbi:MAG TPA: hypothetical protein VGC54_12080 [Planctomycetota bacterium]
MHACLRGARTAIVAASASLLAGCAAPDAEIHLAPLFSRHTVPGYDHAELAGGALRYGEQGGATTWALSPLVWHERRADGGITADFLYPLGRYEHDPGRPRTMARLFPLFWREAEVRPDGVEDLDWFVLPPLFWGGSSSDGKEDYFAFFPFFGTLKNFLTYDEVRFLFFPLWMENRKDGRRSRHVLWPIFGWTTGSETGWRVFPLYGQTEVPGRYKASYFLWPLATFSVTDLDKKHPRTGWLVLPLGGRIVQDDYTATTVLWPVFGWADRPSTDYRSWQVWPILRFERGGREVDRRVSRVFPFWIRYEDAQTEYSSWMWPLFWNRSDEFNDMRRESFYALPFYFSSRTVRDDGRTETKERFWPLAKTERSSDGSEWFSAPAPGIEPLLDSRVLSRNLGFAFEVWAGSAAPQGARERRAFLNLYHQAKAGGHKRWSVAGLAGQWTEPDGTVHTSLLFGLLRFRSGPDSGLELPAFPGPGWPDLHAVAPAAAAGGAER